VSRIECISCCVVLGVALTGCGTSSSGGSDPFFGAPRVTVSQAHAVRMGIPQERAFKQLGGKSPNASVAPSPTAPSYIREAYARNPIDCYDYPVKGTEPSNPDGTGNAIQWSFCFKHGRLVSRTRKAPD